VFDDEGLRGRAGGCELDGSVATAGAGFVR